MPEEADPYDAAAAKYRPQNVSVLFVAESPPTVGPGEALRYFYFTEMSRADWLFRGMMTALGVGGPSLPRVGQSKEPLLLRFQDAGYFLMDVSPAPLPASLKGASAGKRTDYLRSLRAEAVSRVESLGPTTVILIIAHVYRLLVSPLRERGISVPQRGPINFPASGQQTQFSSEMALLRLDPI